MNDFKENECRAWVKSTNERCKKNAQWNLKYCWHHQSKIPIAVAFVIGIVISLIVPKVWEYSFLSSNMQSIKKNTESISVAAKDIEIIKNEISPGIEAKTLKLNKPEGDEFVTEVELYSKSMVPNLNLIVHAKTITNLRVTPQQTSAMVHHRPIVRDGFWIKHISQFNGKYLLTVKTEASELIKIEYSSK